MIRARLTGASGSDASSAVSSLLRIVGFAELRHSDLVHVLGTSMGGLTALNWGWRNPDRVATMALSVPVLNLEAVGDENPSGVGAALIAAYGGQAAFDAALPTHGPEQNWDLIQPLADRLHVWAGAVDPICLIGHANEFVEQTGCQYTINPTGHDFDWDTAAIARWVRATAFETGIIH